MASALGAILVSMLGGSVHGQERSSAQAGTHEVHAAPDHAGGQHGSAEHEFHRNHFGGFVGASTHLDTDSTGFTIGLEYARQFSPRWAAAVYLEQVDSDLERDTIVAVGANFYPLRRVGVVVAPGFEGATKTVENHGETEKESEQELLIRFGVSYGFPLTPQAGIGPAVLADWAGSRWTVVTGVAFVVGF